ncbi:hypothetical protein C8T65DRAFT_834310 [Cerioporus squamosus]|nr:hypothetical protein C8T65DRAFT_834310 [Cerioporus squamosus]
MLLRTSLSDLKTGRHCSACLDAKFRDGFVHDRLYASGQVLAISASVYLPYFHALSPEGAPPIPERHLAGMRARRLDNHDTYRPCVLLTAVDDPGAEVPAVCLLATYDKDPISELPFAFQFFSFKVFNPKCDMIGDPSLGRHLHTTPEWRYTPAQQWIIAVWYRATNLGSNPPGWPVYRVPEQPGRWRTRRSRRPPSAFGTHAMGTLQGIIRECERHWEIVCADPLLLEEVRKEVVMHEAKRSRSTLAPTYKSRASTESAASDLRSLRQALTPSGTMFPTIPEDGPLAQDIKHQVTQMPITHPTGENVPEAHVPSRPRSYASALRANTVDGSGKAAARWKQVASSVSRAIPAPLRRGSKET